MNIKEAKQQIKNAIIAYASQDAYGHPLIPISKQRPVFLMGAPGIGKTAIVEQIAQELDLAFVSYSMTHHTRQSALGLPYIVEKHYQDQTFQVSEYTMSEIIAAVYDEMEKTHKKQGILFLDEINCISETLAPSMLQFLQYKTFGRHQVPEGWIVVTAGNPPEYNQSVKEYDIAIWDRLKRIDVEPDYQVWKEYALNRHVHPVVISYLDIKPSHFYSITTTIDGKNFVTARGWDDLSQMIHLYELHDLPVDEHLIGQYLQDEKIAKDFSHYYQLFHKYQADYQIDTILNGCYSEEIKDRAKQAKFDERLSLIALIMSQLEEVLSQTVYQENGLKWVMAHIKPLLVGGKLDQDQLTPLFQDCLSQMKDQRTDPQTLGTLEAAYQLLDSISQDCSQVKVTLQAAVQETKRANQQCQDALNHVFTFFEEVFGEGQEILILVTEMTIHELISNYIYSHGNAKYYAHNRQLLFEDKQNELMKKIADIHLLDFDTIA